jgi:ABC-2 type transport system permease protein
MMWLRNRSLTWALARRDLARHFNSPLGYLILTSYVVLGALAAFWPSRFFLNNLANLGQLNAVFPYLLGLFVPAMTMGVWADERRHGTDELLLTLPAREWDVVAGKYAAALGLYTATVALSASHVIVLVLLGSPDPGVTIANYAAFWAAGAALIPVGMLASMLHANTTIAFIVGVCFTALLIVAPDAAAAGGGGWSSAASAFGLSGHFRRLAIGLVDAADVAYFVALAVICLYLNTAMLAASRRPDGPTGRLRRAHVAGRALSLCVLFGAALVIGGRLNWRVDVSADRRHSLSDATTRFVRDLPATEAIVIQAFVSPEVPRSHVAIKDDLLAVLRTVSGMRPSTISVHVTEVSAYSPAAQLARERYGITPQPIPDPLGGGAEDEVYLGLAVRAGAEEYVVQFLDRGVLAEYEVARALRAVTKRGRKRLGVVDTDVRLFGGFDPDTNQLRVAWQVVDELRKEYDVFEITPYGAITEGVDALLVVLPSRLTASEMALVSERLRKGTPALIVVDPLSLFDLNLSPAAPMASRINPYAAKGVSAQINYGDIRQMLLELGVNWTPAGIAWDRHNPHPGLSALPSEAVFLSPRNGNPDAINRAHRATRGLHELLLLYPGYLLPQTHGTFTFEPLLQTGTVSGATGFFDVTRPAPTGPVLAAGRTPAESEGRQYTVAAHVRSDQSTNVIVVADLDFVSDYFFDLRRAAPLDVSFDNITFFLNALDVLAGDESLIALRRQHRVSPTLDYVEAQTQRLLEERALEERRINEAAQSELQAARDRLKAGTETIKARRDLDAFDREVMVRNYEAAESRRLRALEELLAAERRAGIQASRESMEREVRRIRSEIRLIAAVLPPVPVVVVAVLMFMRRRRALRTYATESGRARAPA